MNQPEQQPQSETDGPEYPPGGYLDGVPLTGERLIQFVQKWGTRLAPPPEPQPLPPPPGEDRFSFVLLLLRILPYVCGLGFLGSLFWDFDGSLLLPWRPEPVQFEGMLRMITVTGLVGFFTNWLAIKMLFYPREKRPLLGQGLIPSRKDRIVYRLGVQISKEIINSELILEQIRRSGLIAKHREKVTSSLRSLVGSDEFRGDIVELSQHYINQFLKSPEFQQRAKDFVRGLDFENVGFVEGGLLRLYKAVAGEQEISGRLEEIIENLTFRMDRHEDKLAEFLRSIPGAIEEQSGVIEEYALGAVVFLVNQVNVQNVIIENLQRFDEVRLEQLLWRSTSDQLQYIQYLGCFLGLIGGLFIWLPVESLVTATVLGLGVWGLDVLLMRWLGRRAEARSGGPDA